MNTLVLVEIVIGILLAAGIAFAALRTFIKGKDNRPGLLIGSSAVAVVLLVVCLVCTGLQMNRLSSEEPETEVEELAQVRAESVVKKEEKTTAEMENTSAQQEEADKAKKEKAAEREEQAEREKKSADLLADFFGGSSKKTEEETEAADNKTVQADYGNINAAAFTVGVPVYSADEEDDTWDEVTYDDTEPVYELEYEQDDVYSGDSDASDNLLAEFFGGSVNSDDDYTSEYGGYDDYSAEEDPYDYSWYETPSDQDDSSYGSYDEQDYYDYSEYVNDYSGDYYPDDNDYQEPAEETDYPDYYEPEDEDVSYEEPQAGETEYVWSGSVLSQGSGVNYGPLGLETYYNMDMSGVVGIMRAMGYSEEEYPYYVREDGCKMLGGYVMVAANFGQFSRGDVVQCSLGPALVCDTGAGGWNWLDIATNW